MKLAEQVLALLVDRAGIASIDVEPISEEVRTWLNHESPWDAVDGAILDETVAIVADRWGTSASRVSYVLFQRRSDGQWSKEGLPYRDDDRWRSKSPSGCNSDLAGALALAVQIIVRERLSRLG